MMILKFYHAKWCPPCRFFENQFIKPLINAVGVEKVIYINVDEKPQEADRHNVTRLPRAMLEDNGRIVNSSVGMAELNNIIELLGGQTMKIEFLKQCEDKNTKQLYKVGDIVEVTEERAKEILAVKASDGGKFAKKVTEPKAKPKAKK